MTADKIMIADKIVAADNPSSGQTPKRYAKSPGQDSPQTFNRVQFLIVLPRLLDSFLLTLLLPVMTWYLVLPISARHYGSSTLAT